MMVIERDELDFMVEGKRKRVITDALFCAACGYPLRMLPFIGRCPECGNSYNAHSLHKDGIFVPQSAEFPATDILATLASAIAALWLAGGLIRHFDLWTLVFLALFGYLAVAFFRQSYVRLGQFIKGQRMAAQIEGEEEEP